MRRPRLVGTFEFRKPLQLTEIDHAWTEPLSYKPQNPHRRCHLSPVTESRVWFEPQLSFRERMLSVWLNSHLKKKKKKTAEGDSDSSCHTSFTVDELYSWSVTVNHKYISNSCCERFYFMFYVFFKIQKERFKACKSVHTLLWGQVPRLTLNSDKVWKDCSQTSLECNGPWKAHHCQ